MKHPTVSSFFLLLSALCISLLYTQNTQAIGGQIIPVPFTTQAPESNWAEPWQNACEETTIAMVDAFYGNRQFTSTSAKAEILQAFSIKEQAIGASLDENVDTMLKIINNFYPWEAHAVYNPTIQQLTQELDAGRPIILPASGHILNNPHFRSDPPYHTVVLIGYDSNTKQFITHEPGTRFGKEFRYNYHTVMNGMHDFIPGNVENGAKVVLFTTKNINTSAFLDGDNDGLTKKQELEIGTSLFNHDSDGDGYLDGMEVQKNYLPLLDESALLKKEMVLLKSKNSPKVYRVMNNQKRHVLNEYIFHLYGWKWDQITTVSETFLEKIPNGPSISQ